MTTMICDNCGRYGIRWMGPLSALTHEAKKPKATPLRLVGLLERIRQADRLRSEKRRKRRKARKEKI